MTPTIYEWAGGGRRWSAGWNAFYDLVEGDELLAPVFGGLVTEEHRDHVTFLVVGGDGRTRGLHRPPRRLRAHAGQAPRPRHRRRPAAALRQAAGSRAADVAGLPDDPEFRAALDGLRRVGAPAWRSTTRQPGAEVAEQAPCPALGLGRRSALRPRNIKGLSPLGSFVASEGAMWRRSGISVLCYVLALAVVAGAVAARARRGPTPTSPQAPRPRGGGAPRPRPPRRRRCPPRRRSPPAGLGLAVGVTELNANLVASPTQRQLPRAVGRGARRAGRDQARILPARDRLGLDPAVRRGHART